MLVVTLVALFVWGSFRNFKRHHTIAVLLIATFVTSSIVINDVRTAGVFRESITPDYDIVHYNSMSLFPFVVQKHHNWSAQEYYYRVLLLDQDGSVVYEGGPEPDQSEFMHWSLVGLSVAFCGLGFFLAVWIVIIIELVWWYQSFVRSKEENAF